MIRPPGFRGAAFSEAADGDLRGGDRRVAAATLGISDRWAWVDQVHGNTVRSVTMSGGHGSADGIVTSVPGLPVAVFTADCVGIVVETAAEVAVIHAGWRGVVAGIIDAALGMLGHPPRRAAVGPAIGPCCFEVGPEVSQQFDPSERARTSWDTPSVDLPAAVTRRLPDLDLWISDRCTRCGPDAFSHRRDADGRRMATLGWLP